MTDRVAALLPWIALVAWGSVIWYFSSLPQQEIEPMSLPIPHWDKVMHAGAFAVGGALQACALRLNTVWGGRAIFWVSLAAIALFGAVDEWHQLYTATRTGADPFDWLADALGAAVGAGLFLRCFKGHAGRARR
jgi:VanZ family protein